MKTIIEFKDGQTSIVEDAAPCAQTEDNVMGFVGPNMEVVADDISLSNIKRVIFEAD